MSRLVLLSGGLLWAGMALLLSEVRWFSRPTLAARLAPYTQWNANTYRRGRGLSSQSMRDVIAPIAGSTGNALARVFGMSEDLATRLERIHSPLDATAFRVRQLGAATAGFAIGGALSALIGPPVPVAVFFLLGAPLLAFLVLEQKVAKASAEWKRRVFLELPVVGEQVAMLLSAGYSLGTALTRLAERGSGACAQDLRRVSGRMRQGVDEHRALREWSDLAGVTAIDRLVAVLALNQQATDLGRLVSEEARSIRRDVQRELVETMERRGQQVWIPVTVATLVPGVIFISIPFIEALRLFSGQ